MSTIYAHGDHDPMPYDGPNADIAHLCQICGRPIQAGTPALMSVGFAPNLTFERVRVIQMPLRHDGIFATVIGEAGEVLTVHVSRLQMTGGDAR